MSKQIVLWSSGLIAAAMFIVVLSYVLLVKYECHCHDQGMKDERNVTFTILKEIEREAKGAIISLNERTIWSDESPSFVVDKLERSGLSDIKSAVEDAGRKNSFSDLVVIDSRFLHFQFHLSTGNMHNDGSMPSSHHVSSGEATKVGVSRPGFSRDGTGAVILYDTEPTDGAKMLGVMAVTRDASVDSGWRVIDKRVLVVE